MSFRWLACFLILTAAVAVAQTETCNFTPFLSGPSPYLIAVNGVNKSDTVVGTYFTNENQVRGFIRFADGRIEEYRVPKLPASQWVGLYGINDEGQIIGQVSDQQESGFLLTGGKVTLIRYPGASWTQPLGISNGGAIVGGYLKGNDPERAFLYWDGQFSKISVPGSTSTEAAGINDAGVIVGTFGDQRSLAHGFALINNHFTQVDFPGSVQTWLVAVNDAGEIAGNYINATGPVRGFVYKNGHFETIAGAYPTQVSALSSNGDIAGVAYPSLGTEVGYLGTACR